MLGCLHREAAEFCSMPSVEGVLGLPTHRLIECRVHGTAADTNYTRDLGCRDTAQLECHDLLFALGNIDLGARCTLVAALIHLGSDPLGSDRMLTEQWRLTQGGVTKVAWLGSSFVPSGPS